MPKKELTITIPIGDWEDEYLQEELKIQTEADLIDLLQNPKIHPAKLARLVIAGRERKEVPDDLIPANKPLLSAGAALHLSRTMARRMTKVGLSDGREIEVREFVAPVGDEFEDQFESDTRPDGVPTPPPANGNRTGFVGCRHPKAIEYAKKYLFKQVRGDIYNRLALIRLNDGDVKETAEQLKAEIDEIVTRLG